MSDPAGDKAPYIAIAYLKFNSAEALQKASPAWRGNIGRRFQLHKDRTDHASQRGDGDLRPAVRQGLNLGQAPFGAANGAARNGAGPRPARSGADLGPGLICRAPSAIVAQPSGARRGVFARGATALKRTIFGLLAFFLLVPLAWAGGGPAQLNLYDTPAEARWAPFFADMPACEDSRGAVYDQRPVRRDPA